MAIVQTQTQQDGVNRHALGRFLDDAATPALVTITLGFKPRRVSWINLTDRISQEWFEGMAAAQSLQTAAAGTRTLEAATGPTVSASGFTIPAAIVIQNKQYSWEAYA